MKKFRSSLLLKAVLFLSLSLILVFVYSQHAKTLPFSYWDEQLWVGRSVFFDYYLHGQLSHPIWQTYESYDQPKLAEFTFGAWLYPAYLSQRRTSGSLTYAEFLYSNGLLPIKRRELILSDTYMRQHELVTIRSDDGGSRAELVSNYGQQINRPINLIGKVRQLNILLLIAAVWLGFIAVKQIADTKTSVVFIVLYCLNPLLLNTALKAHSEALYLLLFNAALVFLLLYFTQRKEFMYLLAFGMSVALGISTKLNSVVWLMIFWLIGGVQSMAVPRMRKQVLLHSVFIFFVSLVVFMALNPFVLTNPVRNLPYIFSFRQEFASRQQTWFPAVALLDPAARLKRTAQHFFGVDESNGFNSLAVIPDIGIAAAYQRLALVLFLLGVAKLLFTAWRGRRSARIFLVTFGLMTVALMFYLYLDWERYFVHLVLFVVALQAAGLVVGAQVSGQLVRFGWHKFRLLNRQIKFA